MDILLATLFIIVCVLLILVVLLQKGRGGGLGAAFGGAGSSAFGTRTGDVLTWVTIVLTGAFLLLAVLATLVYRPAPGRVDTPMFSLPSGEIDKERIVKIGTSTPKATIYYTLDGVEPTDKNERYNDVTGVHVKPGVTLMARAFKAGMDPSQTATAYYGAPRTMPASAAASMPAASSAPAAPATAPGKAL